MRVFQNGRVSHLHIHNKVDGDSQNIKSVGCKHHNLHISLNVGFQTVRCHKTGHFNQLPECNWVALGIPRWPRSPELTRPAVRERGLDDVMLLDFLFLFVAIKEKEMKLRVGGGRHSQCSARPAAARGL